MLHVRRKKDLTKVSLHRMFVEAPQTVQKALASYIQRTDTLVPNAIKAYIDKNVPTLDHSHLIDPDQMTTKGIHYNLQTLYNRANKRYFAGELDLVITWFGEHGAKAHAKCTLGLYYDQVKLVKIHRLLDNPEVPPYVIEYVIYHEMVHAVCPAYVDEKGRNCIHSKEFKELERYFLAFEEARAWLKKNHKNFFISQRMKFNGRTQQMGKYKAPQKQSRCRKRQNIYTYF